MMPEGQADGGLQAVEVNMQLVLAAAHARVYRQSDFAQRDPAPERVRHKPAGFQSGPPVSACIGSLQDRALDATDLLKRHDEHARGVEKRSQHGIARTA